MATCRSCGAGIRWARTLAGKSIPLDPSPVDDGNLVVVDGVAMSRANANLRGAGPLPLFKSHFATCPNADRHRNPEQPTLPPDDAELRGGPAAGNGG